MVKIVLLLKALHVLQLNMTADFFGIYSCKSKLSVAMVIVFEKSSTLANHTHYGALNMDHSGPYIRRINISYLVINMSKFKRIPTVSKESNYARFLLQICAYGQWHARVGFLFRGSIFSQMYT